MLTLDTSAPLFLASSLTAGAARGRGVLNRKPPSTSMAASSEMDFFANEKKTTTTTASVDHPLKVKKEDLTIQVIHQLYYLVCSSFSIKQRTPAIFTLLLLPIRLICTLATRDPAMLQWSMMACLKKTVTRLVSNNYLLN